MAYKTGDRMQQTFLPSSIDDYVSESDPVRVYDAFVDALDFRQLGIPLEPYNSGADTYYPKPMVKLLIYGYAYGLRSSRKLNRACQHNLSFIWLMGGLTPAYRTIARFRDQYKEQIKNILKQSVRMCAKLGLIDGNSLFIDGSVFKANASLTKTYDLARCQKALASIDQHINQLMDEVQRLDRDETDQESLAKTQTQLHDQQKRKEAVEAIVAELKEQKTFYNTTDPECVKIHKSHKTTAGYNVQTVVDGKHGLIVHAESTNAPNDAGQLPAQIQNAQTVLNKKPKNVIADCGYYSLKELSHIDPEIAVVVPSQQQIYKERNQNVDALFAKDKFIYDEESDQYVCPADQRLNRVGYEDEKQVFQYRAHKHVCPSCSHFRTCTTSKTGRVIKRSIHEGLKIRLEQIYNSPRGQEIYALRKQKSELPFGHLKHNLGAGEFLLKGKDGTSAEVSLLSTGFNITRAITLIGTTVLLMKLPVL